MGSRTPPLPRRLLRARFLSPARLCFPPSPALFSLLPRNSSPGARSARISRANSSRRLAVLPRGARRWPQIAHPQGSNSLATNSSSRNSPQSIPNLLDMNPLRPPSSSSRKVKEGQGRGTPAALAARSASVPGAPVAGNPTGMAAAASPQLPSLQAAGFPAWWTSSSPIGSSEVH